MIDLKILAIDTSGKVASVAVTDGEKLLWEKSVYTKLTHSQVILPMVKQALEETGLTYTDLDCAAIAKGPGSYTGLRIGVAAVKGMCFGCESLKSAGVSTLLSLAYNCIDFEGRIISVMRARPKIVYAGEFQCKMALSRGYPLTEFALRRKFFRESFLKRQCLWVIVRQR